MTFANVEPTSSITAATEAIARAAETFVVLCYAHAAWLGITAILLFAALVVLISIAVSLSRIARKLQ